MFDADHSMDFSIEITQFTHFVIVTPQDKRVQELRQMGSVAEKLLHAKELKDEGNQLLTAARWADHGLTMAAGFIGQEE